MKYTVTAPFIQLHSGVLTLTREQAASRAHNLRKTRAGYEIVHAVQFKRGEKIGYDGELTHELAEAFGVKGKEKEVASSVQTSAPNPPDGGTDENPDAPDGGANENPGAE